MTMYMFFKVTFGYSSPHPFILVLVLELAYLEEENYWPILFPTCIVDEKHSTKWA